MFCDVLQAVWNWLSEELEKNNDMISAEIVSHTAENLLVTIDSGRYVGELNVSKPDFRPYRYVGLYILDTRKDETQPPAFVYYDGENDSVSDIIDNLNKGINFILSEK